MCLRNQGIGNDNDGVGRVRQVRGLSYNDGGVVRGKGIDDASKGPEKTAKAARA